MADTIDAKSLADLLDSLMKWLQQHPNGDLQNFADQHDCTVQDVADSWNHAFSPDFSRHYNLDGDVGHGYHPAHPPHGDAEAIKEYVTREVNNYNSYSTVNNIEDNSFNQQINAKGDVNQDLNIDNSHTVADHGGVAVGHGGIEHSDIATGDHDVQHSSKVLDGDVHTTAGHDGQAQTGINFGDGDLKQNQQSQDVHVSGDNHAGDASADGTGGAGFGGDAHGGHGGEGGDGGEGGNVHGLLPVGDEGGLGGAGGDGGGAHGGDASGHGGEGTGGHADGGDAGHHVEVTQGSPF